MYTMPKVRVGYNTDVSILHVTTISPHITILIDGSNNSSGIYKCYMYMNFKENNKKALL